jgi:hypothetical protein
VIALLVLLLCSVHVIVDKSLSLEEILAALLLLNKLLGFGLILLLLPLCNPLLEFLYELDYL